MQQLLHFTALLSVSALLASCSSGPKRWTASVPAPIRILAIGDSHFAGPFGIQLDKHLRTINDASVNFYGSCGSIAKTWTTGKGTKCGAFMHEQNEVERIEQTAQTPQLFTKWKDFEGNLNPGIFTQNPTHVIIEFGANYAGYNDVFIETDLDTLFTNIEKIGAKCFFISMPDTRREDIRSRQQAIIDIATAEASGRCKFFNSTREEITKYPDWDPPEPERPFDGVHYNRKELLPMAEAWAEAVFKDFKTGGGL